MRKDIDIERLWTYVSVVIPNKRPECQKWYTAVVRTKEEKWWEQYQEVQLKKWCVDVYMIMHECFHIMWWVKKYHWIEDDETLAYLQARLVKKIEGIYKKYWKK